MLSVAPQRQPELERRKARGRYLPLNPQRGNVELIIFEKGTEKGTSGFGEMGMEKRMGMGKRNGNGNGKGNGNEKGNGNGKGKGNGNGNGKGKKNGNGNGNGNVRVLGFLSFLVKRKKQRNTGMRFIQFLFFINTRKKK